MVLSGGRHLPPGSTKIIEWYDPDRFLAGIDLYKANKSNRLIFTGGINPLASDLPPEGDIYINEAISMGIPEEDLFTTYPVNNTLQEAKAIKKLLNDEIALIQKEIILVTSAFHMKRAKKVFEREGISVQPYPVDFKSDKSFLSSLRNPLKRLDYSLVTPSDGIVVLSSRRHLPPGNTKIIEWYDPDRFLAGIDLYKANKSNRLIFTGGINPLTSDLPPEGDIYIKEAVSMGLPKEDLYTTYPVNNTLQLSLIHI